jgi:hypothetical protein
MPPSKQTEQPIDPGEALEIIEILTEEARETSNEAIKEILLLAACEIANLSLDGEAAAEKAA